MYHRMGKGYLLLLLLLWQNLYAQKKLTSYLEIFDLEKGTAKLVYQEQGHFEAPNWSRDGKFLVYNSNGRLFRIGIEGGIPQLINSDFANKCNNDHGISPDGKLLVISHHDKKDGKSKIYTFPITGGKPELVTPLAPSYWHGWAPEGDTLAYCAERGGEFDIYTIAVKGGKEKRLTTAKGLDDGPDYSYDGKWIYFNSVRTGKMKIWRMRTDGSQQQQLTFDELNDWFPHPSPDGKSVIFVSYGSEVEGHPPNKNVQLRIMKFEGGTPDTLLQLFGGQGTINVPSWSPDSKYFAFVRYSIE